MPIVMVQPIKKSKMQCVTARPTLAAFSMIELAVVLAIIGLLAGGIMATTSYLNNARQNTVMDEGKYYLNALKQFEVRYGGALPGDMGNATDYWTGTANGNGNGMLGDVAAEMFRAFQHLSLAGLISGQYSGVAGSGGASDGDIGVNVPVLSMQGVSGHYFTYSATGYVSGDANLFDGYYPTYFVIGKDNPNWVPGLGFLTPRQAQKLDQKFDDGIPSTGNVRVPKTSTSCYSSATAYAPTATTDACNFVMTLP